jgi:hypothetical protein
MQHFVGQGALARVPVAAKGNVADGLHFKFRHDSIPFKKK